MRGQREREKVRANEFIHGHNEQNHYFDYYYYVHESQTQNAREQKKEEKKMVAKGFWGWKRFAGRKPSIRMTGSASCKLDGGNSLTLKRVTYKTEKPSKK